MKFGQECIYFQVKNAAEEGLAYMIARTNEYKQCFRIYFGPLLCVVTCVHPEAVKTVLRHTEMKQINGSYRLVKPWLGEFL